MQHAARVVQWTACTVGIVSAFSESLEGLMMAAGMLCFGAAFPTAPVHDQIEWFVCRLLVHASFVVSCLVAGAVVEFDVGASADALVAVLVTCTASFLFMLTDITLTFRSKQAASCGEKAAFRQCVRNVLASYTSVYIAVILGMCVVSADVRMDHMDAIACVLVVCIAYVWMRDTLQCSPSGLHELLDSVKRTGQVAAFARSCADVLHDRQLSWSDIGVTLVVYLSVDIVWFVVTQLLAEDAGTRRLSQGKVFNNRRKQVQPEREMELDTRWKI